MTVSCAYARHPDAIGRRGYGVAVHWRRFLLALLLGSLACASAATRYHMPSSLQGYAILVPASDTLSWQLAQALRRRGLAVQRRVRGGGGPTAVLVHFTYRDPQLGEPLWLHVRLADTRTGSIVGAVGVALDSLPPDPAALAETILDSLGLGRRPLPEP